jgi:polar amino acid transport system substrate-binding protein
MWLATSATLVEFPTPDETIAAVRSGEADAVLADSDFLRPIVDESGGELEFIGEPLYIGGALAWAFARPTMNCAKPSTPSSPK